MNGNLLKGFFLGDVLVEPHSGQLSRGEQCVHLGPRAMEVLLCLASRPAALCERGELLAEVWGEGRGSADGLSHAISEVRHALGDDPANPRYIQTVPRRGYRLLASPRLRPEVDQLPAAQPAAPPERSGLIGALLRHGVIQAGAAYAVLGWILIQVADVTFDNLGLPAWSEPFVTFAVFGGLPVVLLLAWFLEFAGGRVVRDRGESDTGLISGLENNLVAVVAGMAAGMLGAAGYQALVGFAADEEARVADVVEAPAPEAELIPVRDNALAVLRFRGEEGTEAFASGISEEVLHAISRVPGLRVSARGDAWSLPPDAPSAHVRRRLRVAYFVTGSVRRVGDRLRVEAQLVDTQSGFQVLARSFERPVEAFADFRDEIASLVVGGLRVALPQELQQIGPLESEAAPVDAYVLYRRGRDQLDAPPSRESLAAAAASFEQALAIDPDYAAAHAGLCRVHGSHYVRDRDPEAIDRAAAACAAAVAAGPQLPEVHEASGSFYAQIGEFEQAERSFRRALDADPSRTEAQIGLAKLLAARQQPQDAETLLLALMDQHPGSMDAMSALGVLYYGSGRFQDAAEQYARMVFLDPDNHHALGNLGASRFMLGEFDAARAAWQRSVALNPEPASYSNLGVAHYYSGDFGAAAEAYGRAIDESGSDDVAWINLADALHFAGDEAAAREAFARAAELCRQRLETNEKDVEAMSSLAWALAMTGSDREALAWARRAVALDPDDYYAHYYRGLVQLRAGRPEAAKAALREAEAHGFPRVLLAAEHYLEPLGPLEGWLDAR